MPVDPDLVTRLERSLQAQASDVTPAPRAFDPDADLCFPDLGVEGHGRRRSMARIAVTVAAAILLVVVAVWAGRRSKPASLDVTNGGQLTAGTGLLAPTWMPAGVQLWWLSWSEAPKSRVVTPQFHLGSIDDGVQPRQLFGADGATRSSVLISIAPLSNITVGGGGHAQRIRGLPGTLQDVTKGSARRYTELQWREGVIVTADLRGMSIRDGVSFLDGLHWRSPDHLQGFAAPTTGGLRLLADAPRSPIALSGASTQFSYSQRPQTSGAGLGQGKRIEVDVEDEPAAAARQTILTTWFDGKQRSDGVYESYEPVARALQLVSRSGRTISVSGGSGSDEDHRIVAGLQVRTEPQLAALLHQSEQRTNAWSTRYVLAAPKLASAALADGTVELRGTATATHRTPGTYFAICVTLRHAPVVCSPPVTAIEGNPHIWSLIIGGHWYLAGASSVRSPVGKPVLHALRPPDQVGAALPAETARSDGWWITLLRPAPNVESVVNPDGSPVATRPQG